MLYKLLSHWIVGRSGSSGGIEMGIHGSRNQSVGGSTLEVALLTYYKLLANAIALKVSKFNPQFIPAASSLRKTQFNVVKLNLFKGTAYMVSLDRQLMEIASDLPTLRCKNRNQGVFSISGSELDSSPDNGLK